MSRFPRKFEYVVSISDELPTEAKVAVLWNWFPERMIFLSFCYFDYTQIVFRSDQPIKMILITK